MLTILCGMCVLVLPLAVGGADYSDLTGQYCARRRKGGDCCAGREDECSEPILGTLCYCDVFCNRTVNEDCCPDYWSHCLNMPVSAPFIEGCPNGIPHRGTTQNNCNKCKCEKMDNKLELICEREKCMVEPDIIVSINSGGSHVGWRATNYSDFWGRHLTEGIKYKLGTLHPARAVMNMKPVNRVYDPNRLPLTFDARNKWRGFVQQVSDQGWCGASWAVSTASVAADRLAIMTNGTETVRLSANHMLACNDRGQQGCEGGHLDRAWNFMRKSGIVNEECFPYVAGRGEVGTCRFPRRGGNLLTARCPLSQSAVAVGRTDFYKMGPAVRLGSETDIMDEIYTSGPVQATMKVYHDFFMYRSGVYRTTLLGAADRTGYHSVRIIGWGEDGGDKYWLVANSWGSDWGENGFFRIARGVNECEIEDFVLGSWAFPAQRKHNGRSHRRRQPNNNLNSLYTA